MDRLWTPWRYAYISGADAGRAKGVPEALSAWPGADPTNPLSSASNCVFCNMIASVDFAIDHGMSSEDAERAALIVARSRHSFLCLNRFPYSTGHALIVPYDHTDSLAGLRPEVAQEIMSTAQQVDTALRAVYHPDGLNFGLNLGEAAGAGVASHLHMHALPRWAGDTNFMTVTGETRIIPELLETTWKRLRDVFPARNNAL
ncbi:HIT family protein [Granulicella sibirica]|uniref:Histidine triad (HIT) protein n=1 Tax=Granulicella sibirica TaxID=2479048 RepID=A0A4Q0T4R3_9BACT|nr:HIT domain-containing protein [Granulicella sibirica]RXH58663.1 histidine triad (HIT) protein [Granulicella sibirica]